jgi:hypothetical protein
MKEELERVAGQQQEDGRWKSDSSFINEGATNRYNSDVLRITAYIAWSLENTEFQGPAVERPKRLVEKHMSAKVDTYTLAVLANFAADIRMEITERTATSRARHPKITYYAQPYFFAALILAQRARCAAAILFRPAADIVRREALGCAFPFARFAPVPPSRCST